MDADREPAGLEAQAKAIEIQIIAPCCKTQTLDVHDSPVVTSMKQEIRARLALGDPPEAILRTFEQRYGPDVLAVRSSGTANHLGTGLAFMGVAGALGVAYLLRRWVRAGAATRKRGGVAPANSSASDSASSPASGAAPSRDVWDDRVDEELEALGR